MMSVLLFRVPRLVCFWAPVDRGGCWRRQQPVVAKKKDDEDEVHGVGVSDLNPKP